jgi:hypothetical protein
MGESAHRMGEDRYTAKVHRVSQKYHGVVGAVASRKSGR